MWNWFKPSGTIRTPLTPVETRHAARTFEFRRQFACRCGAQLTIRSREDRSSGPSNFQAFAHGTRAGHSMVPSSALTWNGLAEERGWKTAPVMCPACQRGLSLAEYKQAHRG